MYTIINFHRFRNHRNSNLSIKFAGIIIILLIMLIQCKEDDDFVDMSPQLTFLTSGIIGSEGGSIEIDDISIIFPGGALDHETEITIYEAINDDVGFIDNRLTEAFRVEGIPSDISIPVQVQFNAPDSYEGDICLNIALIGKTANNADTLLIPYSPFICQETEGLITVEFPSFHTDLPVRKSTDKKTVLEFLVSAGWKTLESDNNKFFLRYQSTDVLLYQVDKNTGIEVLDFFENALVFYKNMGFEHETRHDDWPIEIKVISCSPDILSSFIFKRSEHKIRYIPFNRSYLKEDSDLEMLKKAVIRFIGMYELFLYEETPWWICYAIPSWSEELWYEKNTPYLPYLFEEYPVHQVSCMLNDINQAYRATRDLYLHNEDVYVHRGLAPIIKYLVKHYGNEDIGRVESESILVKMAKEINSSDKTNSKIPTIDKVLGKSNREWFPEFIIEYVTGQIYPVNIEPLSEKLENTFKKVEKGYEEYYKVNGRKFFGDLATCWFKIELPSNVDLERTSIKLFADGGERINTDFIEILAFSGKNISDLQFLKRGNPVYVDDVLDLVYDEKDLWIAMTKCADEHTYIGSEDHTAATLTMSVLEEPKEYLDGSIMTISPVTMTGTWTGTDQCDKETWEESTGISIEINNSVVTGNELRAVWDYSDRTDRRQTAGDVKIVFKDETLKEITDVYVYDYGELAIGSRFNKYQKFTLTDVSIKWVQSPEGGDVFKMDGCGANFVVQEYFTESILPVSCITKTMVTYSCNENTKIGVSLYY